MDKLTASSPEKVPKKFIGTKVPKSSTWHPEIDIIFIVYTVFGKKNVRVQRYSENITLNILSLFFDV
jgi:hypothetical protein